MNPTLDSNAMPGPLPGEAEPTPCDRCGGFETLTLLRGQMLCEHCTDRVLHPIERTPVSVESLLLGVWQMTRQLAGRALLLLVVFELPLLVFTALVPAAERLDRFSWLITVVADGAVILLVMQVLESRPVSIKSALEGAMQRWGPMIWASILNNLVVFFFTLLLIVPGVMRALSYAVVLPVVLHDQGRGSDALSRSSALMEGSRLPLFVVWIVLFLPSVILTAGYIGIALWVGGEFGEAPVLSGGIYTLIDVVVPLAIVITLIPLKLAPAVVYAKVRYGWERMLDG